MTDDATRAQLRGLIRDRLGAIMHNPVRELRTTCRVCTAPSLRRGYANCWECSQHVLRTRRDDAEVMRGLADRVVPLTYAIEGEQSNLDMHRYKNPMREDQRHASDAWQRLALLVLGFSMWHVSCLNAISSRPPSGLATVPSLRGRTGPHPLDGLASYLPRAWRPTRLLARLDVPEAERRLLDAGHFTVEAPADVDGRHVVVLDDTWVRGGHAQSAAAAVRAAGAAEVTVLTVARRITPDFGSTRDFIHERLRRREYSIEVCPLTGADCPR